MPSENDKKKIKNQDKKKHNDENRSSLKENIIYCILYVQGCMVYWYI